jgi:hypothetical protein
MRQKRSATEDDHAELAHGARLTALEVAVVAWQDEGDHRTAGWVLAMAGHRVVPSDSSLPCEPATLVANLDPP